jgi:hypothetical protein
LTTNQIYMVDLEFTEITMAGVQHLEIWLKENGYESINVDTWMPELAEIQADSRGGENILLQARTVLHPNEQFQMNGTDKFALKDLALRMGRIPYVAYLVIDENKNLIGDINWERLT